MNKEEMDKQIQDAYQKFAILLTRHAEMTTDAKELNYHKGFITTQDGGQYMVGIFHVNGPTLKFNRTKLEKV